MAVTGRAVLLMLLGLGAVVVAPATLTARLWFLTVLVLVLVDAALAVPPARLVWTRRPSDPVRLGQAATTSLVVENPTTRTVHALVRDAWQPSAGAGADRYDVRLRPGERRELTTTLTPVRRGDRRADLVTVRLHGPLGLGARQRSQPVAGVVRVLPAFPSRRHLPGLLSTLRLIDGRAAVRTRGQGTEFDSLREYVDGDDVRSIDWRASARRRDVVVRTWQPERDRHVVVVLDTSRTSAGRVGDAPRLDAGMDAVQLLAAVATRGGDRVDVLAGDRVVRARVLAGRTDLLPRLTEALAPVEPALVEADWPTLIGEVLARARRRCVVVLVTPIESAALEEGLVPVLAGLTARHTVLLASVRDPELDRLAHPPDDRVVDEAAAYDAAAAAATLSRRERTGTVLRTLGVDVLDEDPDRLGKALADRYLALKSHGRL